MDLFNESILKINDYLEQYRHTKIDFPRIKYSEIDNVWATKSSIVIAKQHITGQLYLQTTPLSFYHQHIHNRSSSSSPIHFYEVIPPNLPIRLFFDFDNTIPEGFFAAVDVILFASFPHLSSPFPYLVKSACTPTKSSYHVVYPSVLFPSISSMKNWILLSLKFFVPTFDSSVYTSRRLLRTLHSSKFTDPLRPFIPDHTLSSLPDFAFRPDIFFQLSLIYNPITCDMIPPTYLPTSLPTATVTSFFSFISFCFFFKHYYSSDYSRISFTITKSFIRNS
jgi:hypothetical protein